eukprot:TRINITY_DN49010_c0_g1_i2.p1 TRINITY_DN49010_c0_g1~~TRINITY_DN49010_c0_g1_i2.p1  ORF type:complete len:248 (+),score=30.84 TRINITY_DN49010_c0_g1_i2:40-744(+)
MSSSSGTHTTANSKAPGSRGSNSTGYGGYSAGATSTTTNNYQPTRSQGQVPSPTNSTTSSKSAPANLHAYNYANSNTNSATSTTSSSYLRPQQQTNSATTSAASSSAMFRSNSNKDYHESNVNLGNRNESDSQQDDSLSRFLRDRTPPREMPAGMSAAATSLSGKQSSPEQYRFSEAAGDSTSSSTAQRSFSKPSQSTSARGFHSSGKNAVQDPILADALAGYRDYGVRTTTSR